MTPVFGLERATPGFDDAANSAAVGSAPVPFAPCLLAGGPPPAVVDGPDRQPHPCLYPQLATINCTQADPIGCQLDILAQHQLVNQDGQAMSNQSQPGLEDGLFFAFQFGPIPVFFWPWVN